MASNSLKVKRGKRLRVYRRDRWRCRECGETCREDVADDHPRRATLDHIVRREDGGDDSEENLRLACRECNQAKEGVGPGLLGSRPGVYAKLRSVRSQLADG